jgi:uroporphyrin-III C-methyltransferase
MSAATVYLVGAGPGAADLITLRGARALSRAQIVFADTLAGDELKALAPQARWVNVGKRCGGVSVAQSEICDALVEAANHYDKIVRLKGGDPMIFGRADEEIAALRAAGIAHEVVPGITTACAAAASLKVSFTSRGVRRSVSFATPSVGADLEKDQSWLNAVRGTDATALYMASHQREFLAKQMLDAGVALDKPVIAMQSVSTPNERRWVGTVGSLPTCPLQKEDGPILLLIGVPLTIEIPAAQFGTHSGNISSKIVKSLDVSIA